MLFCGSQYYSISWEAIQALTLNTGVTVYKYIITFDQEVAHVWKMKPTAASLLSLSIHWIIVLAQITNPIPSKPSLCKRLSCMTCTESWTLIYRCQHTAYQVLARILLIVLTSCRPAFWVFQIFFIMSLAQNACESNRFWNQGSFGDCWSSC